MEQSQIIDFTREAIMLCMKLSAPIMVIGLAVGLIISLIQALTQIQEATLSFVPKILTIFIAIFVLFPFMAQAMQAFMTKIADQIVNIG